MDSVDATFGVGVYRHDKIAIQLLDVLEGSALERAHDEDRAVELFVIDPSSGSEAKRTAGAFELPLLTPRVAQALDEALLVGGY
jgi:hypothetical protein